MTTATLAKKLSKTQLAGLEKKFITAGIAPSFINAVGEEEVTTIEVKQSILDTFNGNIHSRTYPIPAVKVFYQDEEHILPLERERKNQKLEGRWLLELENGETLTGLVANEQISLPTDLPLGYHSLTLTMARKKVESRIIVAPKSCFKPQALVNEQKLWGSFIQLYTLKSGQNWGIGDFADLYEFIEKITPYGADFLGLNPIHALFPANPDSASPYSPSSRNWLNVAYIAVHHVPEFQQSTLAQQWFNSAEIQGQLHALRATDWVDYNRVIPLKIEGLKLAFAEFKNAKNQHRTLAFQQFLVKGGESLQVQATFDALHAQLTSLKADQWGWDFWEEKYQDYSNEAVQQFRKQNANDVEFYAWLQFIANEQLQKCHERSQQAQMSVGMYRDLAVGVTGNGAETWNQKDLYCLDASVGAPPDILGPQGQNWGLTPMNPHVLKDLAYEPFIKLVQSNMDHCGALRIDHIMSLLRLWWIRKGDSAKNGAYVSYPVDDLIAILALESVRHQCLIIGEDLGTVPAEIVSKLKNAGILSYKIFYFEFDHEGKSRNLGDYPYQAMTTLSTHDLPTIDGYWRGYDFELGEKYGVYPNPDVLEMLKKGRVEAKGKILDRLREAGWEIPTEITAELNSDMNKGFIQALQWHVSHVNSALFGFQPEDWIAMHEPVNIPGTSTEYANWRRKLSTTTEDIFNDGSVQELLREVNKTRKAL